ncbi:hypothetical protein [Flavobacterium ovatum]|uniref:hypothetical protein n=1 Tax=Flavobacterium ovatum TaxID=1928857 RepID=UPI00344F308C
MSTLENIYDDITSTFGNLWSFKSRGKSIEIITPFATTNHRFISVFISIQGDEFIVSDGGWIEQGIYDNNFNLDEDCYKKIIMHYQDVFKIKETKNAAKTIYFYKKTSNPISVASIVFDLSNFVSTIVSLSFVEYTEKEEKETKERFNKKANLYLTTIVDHEHIKFNSPIGDNKKIKFNAIVTKNKNELILLNYITGSSDYYFSNSISKTNMIFEMALKTPLSSFISKKISIIDTDASGYIPQKVNPFLNHLFENTGSIEVNWHEKEILHELLNN